jgi:hypothetical protein
MRETKDAVKRSIPDSGLLLMDVHDRSHIPLTRMFGLQEQSFLHKGLIPPNSHYAECSPAVFSPEGNGAMNGEGTETRGGWHAATFLNDIIIYNLNDYRLLGYEYT